MLENSFISRSSKTLMSSRIIHSSLRDEYDNSKDFLENFNVFIKRQKYAINITETKRRAAEDNQAERNRDEVTKRSRK